MDIKSSEDYIMGYKDGEYNAQGRQRKKDIVRALERLIGEYNEISDDTQLQIQTIGRSGTEVV